MLSDLVALILLDTDWESELDGVDPPNHLDTLSSNSCHSFVYPSSVSRGLVMDELVVATEVLFYAVGCAEH